MVETYHTVIVEESINNGYIVCAKNNEDVILERVTSVSLDDEGIGLRVKGQAKFDAAAKRMEVDIVTIREPREEYEEAQISFVEDES